MWENTMDSVFDLYQTVTDRVLELMREHGANWTNPFNKSASAYQASNPVTGQAYRGINQFLLATTSYPLPYWAGFSQWHAKACHVKAGERSTMIVYWKMLERVEIVDGKEKKITRPLLRYLNVFNVAQVVGDYADKLRATIVNTPQTEAAIVERAEQYFKATGATIRINGEQRAYYVPQADYVHMPARECFTATKTSSATECYYSTLAHEMTHWTGHNSRLDRDQLGKFGDPRYAFEELIAELGAAMICAQIGVSVEPRADHAQYLNSWITALKDNNGAILKAAGYAKAAAAFIAKTQVSEAA